MNEGGGAGADVRTSFLFARAGTPLAELRETATYALRALDVLAP
jgi:hypothetical protein